MILAFYLFTLRKSDLHIHKEDCNWDQLCNIYTGPCMLFYTYSKWVHNTFPEPVSDLSKKIFHIFAGLVSSWSSVFVAPKYVLPDRQHLENMLHKGWLWWENALYKQHNFQEKRCCVAELTIQYSCLDDFWVLFSQNSPRHFCHYRMIQIKCLRRHL